jgi:hypothetical protein
MASTKDRKPAQLVKCPVCNWTGSARGLFSHHRLSHPKDNKLIGTKATLIKSHPHSITKPKKKAKVGSLSLTGDSLTDSILTLLIPVAVKLISDYIETQQQPKREANKVHVSPIRFNSSNVR